MKRIVRRHVRGFVKSVRALDWFEWFYLSFIVFASALFWTVVDILWKAFHP